jgi:hypothetical protein
LVPLLADLQELNEPLQSSGAFRTLADLGPVVVAAVDLHTFRSVLSRDGSNLLGVMCIDDLSFDLWRKHVSTCSNVGLRTLAAMCVHADGLEVTQCVWRKAVDFAATAAFIDASKNVLYCNTAPLWLDAAGNEQRPHLLALETMCKPEDLFLVLKSHKDALHLFMMSGEEGAFCGDPVPDAADRFEDDSADDRSEDDDSDSDDGSWPIPANEPHVAGLNMPCWSIIMVDLLQALDRAQRNSQHQKAIAILFYISVVLLNASNVHGLGSFGANAVTAAAWGARFVNYHVPWCEIPRRTSFSSHATLHNICPPLVCLLCMSAGGFQLIP